jgi:hypothetical protein
MKIVLISIHTYHSRFIPEYQRQLRSTKTPTFYQNDLAMINTADVTDGKPIAARSQSISGVNAVNSLVAFTTSMEERDVLLYSSVPDTTRDRRIDYFYFFLFCFFTFIVN